MAYDVYPYSYRNFQSVPIQVEDKFELPPEPKRGDLEGYIAAKDFASQTYSSAVCSNAQVKIRQLNNLRYDMTAKEYINILIKQGQIPEKHFKYQKNENEEIISELNSSRDMVKKVIFSQNKINGEPYVISKYYNPETGTLFKEIIYVKNQKPKIQTFYSEFEDFDASENSIINNSAIPICKMDNPFGKLTKL